MRDEAGFREFVETNGATLLHAARLLTGDHHRGEDLMQTVLTKMYGKWGRIDAPVAYARRALVSAHIDSTRRRWWGERPTETLPDVPTSSSTTTPSDERDDLRRMLADLEPRSAPSVLRYYCDLSEQDTAAALKMPVGTVKSTSSRALSRLRVNAASTTGGAT